MFSTENNIKCSLYFYLQVSKVNNTKLIDQVGYNDCWIDDCWICLLNLKSMSQCSQKTILNERGGSIYNSKDSWYIN